MACFIVVGTEFLKGTFLKNEALYKSTTHQDMYNCDIYMLEIPRYL